MREEVIHVYRFKELNEKAKDKARQEFGAAFGFERADEYMASITKLAEHFDGKVADYSVDWFKASHSFMRFKMPDMDRKEIARRLRQLGKYNRSTGKGLGECKLTGCCYDESAIDGFRAAFRRGETELEQMMQAAFEQWLKDGQTDCEYDYGDEGFGETCEANDYEFYKDGTIYKKGEL